MSHFFQPNSKVQKDRHVMRETDARMAKYSRRGLIFNFIAFLICLVGGRFVQENKELTVILASGLLLVTFLRGFYLFRFDQHYPRGPARWRNVYFVVTLIGAIWWGVILASITLVLGLEHETPLLWLYTVVFFSTTAHAFAPYHRFLSYYQFVGLVPAAAGAIIVGGLSGYIYGSLMLMFYLILTHQCRLISDNYWEKLEAGYALSNRDNTAELEKINTQATLQLNKEFVDNLNDELGSILENEIETTKKDYAQKIASVKKMVSLYNQIQHRGLTIESHIFNVRHELQSIVAEFVCEAESKQVLIESSLSPNLPMRLQGDPARFAQIVRTLLSHTIDDSADCAVILDVQFLREYESAGELHVSLKRTRNKASGMQFFTEAIKSETPKSIELSLAKALAEILDGEIEIIELEDNTHDIRFTCRLDIVDRTGQLDFHKNRFNGNQILFVSSNPAIAAIKRQELDALGFTTSTETHFKRVAPTLIQEVKAGNPNENVLIYNEPDSEACQSLLKELLESDSLKSLNKIIAASEVAQRNLIEEGFSTENGFYFVSKPVGLFELESTFEYMYSTKGDVDSLALCKSGTIVIFEDHPGENKLNLRADKLPNQNIVHATLKTLNEVLTSNANVLVVVPCSSAENAVNALHAIRASELNRDNDDSFIPVIGVGNGCSESDIAAFEIGFDDFIDQSSVRSAGLASTLRYWRSLSQ